MDVVHVPLQVHPFTVLIGDTDRGGSSLRMSREASTRAASAGNQSKHVQRIVADGIIATKKNALDKLNKTH